MCLTTNVCLIKNECSIKNSKTSVLYFEFMYAGGVELDSIDGILLSPGKWASCV